MNNKLIRHYNIPIFIPHLGCPFQCIFCDQNKIASQQDVPDKIQTIKIVEQYLQTMPDDAEVEIAFFGGNFTALPEPMLTEYLEAVNPYLKSGRVSGVRISTRPDCIDENILVLLKTWGVKTIELGVQSLSDKVLKASARGYKAEDVFKASRLIKENDFKLGLQLMIGLPGDSSAIARETTARAIALQPDMVRIYPTVVIAGTPLETMLHQGQYNALTLPEAVTMAKDMFLLFQQHGIEVIRMGLQPSEDLRSSGTIVAGPFHSSFGELVEQEVFKEQAEAAINQFAFYQGRPSCPRRGTSRRMKLLGRSRIISNLPIYTCKIHGIRVKFYAKNMCRQINIYVNSRDVSKLVGSRRNNINYLKKIFNLDRINIKTMAGNERDYIGISSVDKDYPEMVLHRQEMRSSP